MQIWVTMGAPPMPGMLMPRDFIIAMASGGICGMFGISMLVEMFHRPGLPCAAQAAAGASRMVVAINPETNLRFMAIPLLALAANLTGRQPLSISWSEQ